MSGHSLSASQQTGCTVVTGRPDGGEESQSGDDSIKIYLHCVSDSKAALLVGTGSNSPLQTIAQNTGADVQLPINSSLVESKTIVVIRGSHSQIEAAVSFINELTSVEEQETEMEKFWLQWVENAFPDLDSRAYFFPPIHFNRVPMTTDVIAGQEVLVLQSTSGEDGQHNQQERSQSIASEISSSRPTRVQDSDVRDDAAHHRVLSCLQELFQRKGEIVVVINKLNFQQYLSEPCYNAAAAQLPLPASLSPSLPRNWKQGDFDLLFIHRNYGIIVCEVKAFGDNVTELNMTQQDIDNNIRKKLEVAMTQLDKAEAMLSHLVSDIAPGLRITKTIAVPNLTNFQVQQALSNDLHLAEEMSQCLGTADLADITGLCLCSDLLFDQNTQKEKKSKVLIELGNWWQRCVAGAGPDRCMTTALYKRLVARFCGPATTVTVPCTSPPRLSIKTLGQAVWWTGEVYTAQIALFPEQVDLLNTAPSNAHLQGPPGTGKTVMLLLMGLKWLRCGHDVDVLSYSTQSRAASFMLYHLLLKTVQTQRTAGETPGQPRLRLYDFHKDGIQKAVTDLLQAEREGALYILADEEQRTTRLDMELLKQVHRLHIWSANRYSGGCRSDCSVEYLSRPLRSPPVVVREIEKDLAFRRLDPLYSDRDVPDHTDGPPVRRLHHLYNAGGHTDFSPVSCAKCGHEVATFLFSLRIGVPAEDVTATYTTATSHREATTSRCLQWRDVLVVYGGSSYHSNYDFKTSLEDADIPVRVIEKDDDFEDVATARSDVVWFVPGEIIGGLERKVVVCLEPFHDKTLFLSRCTSQLVIISVPQN
ncbi:uncharacterized protein LOC112575029 isoform X2 [Pomacea canaliculata]|uniref:uncharacterized protein LOC112575029 isoform X2 n=1 Tax=Pomacea canaliculata TaxID=400727 RepID=UPI000D73EA87|nr:uncharacterized protein LOC112575029 isoform X2 [Pomacea canaliculata]